MPFKRRFKDKYAGSSRERICCPNSVRLVFSHSFIADDHEFVTSILHSFLSSSMLFMIFDFPLYDSNFHERNVKMLEDASEQECFEYHFVTYDSYLYNHYKRSQFS